MVYLQTVTDTGGSSGALRAEGRVYSVRQDEIEDRRMMRKGNAFISEPKSRLCEGLALHFTAFYYGADQVFRPPESESESSLSSGHEKEGPNCSTPISPCDTHILLQVRRHGVAFGCLREV